MTRWPVLLLALLLLLPSAVFASIPTTIDDGTSAQPSQSTGASSLSSLSLPSGFSSLGAAAAAAGQSTLLSNNPSMGGTQALAQPQFSYASGATYVPKLAPNATGQKFKNNRTQLTLGYLTALKGNMKDKQGLTISGALTIALEEINNDPDLLPNVTLALRWYDTRGETVTATRHITEMICDGVSAIFGPEGTCKTEAIVSQSRDIPMISYVSGGARPGAWEDERGLNGFFSFAEMFRTSSQHTDSNVCQNGTAGHTGKVTIII